MESGINNSKLKVVWLCEFSNQELNGIFNTPQVKERSPWITNLIELFQDRDDIEIHIVAPNIFKNKQHSIIIRNVHYHFYKCKPNFVVEKVYRRILRTETLTNYYLVKKRIKKIIRNINPDIIHLHGAENAYYSAGILPVIELYCVLVTIQGFIRNTRTHDSITAKKIKIEEEILKRAKHFGVRTKDMSKTVMKFNSEASLHFHNYPLTMPVYKKDNSVVATYDIVFFARICKDKGIEDLLEALAIIKNERPAISLHVIGWPQNKSYLKYLNYKTKLLNIEANVKFIGFIANQQDVFKHAINARIYVLPTYHDIIPGTILESMFMKLPVIAYAVGGIPELNDKGQAIVLVEKDNIKQLANEIVALLNNENKRNELAEFAYIIAKERFINSNIVSQIMSAYNEIFP